MLSKLEHPARNKVLCCGRRWRKTTLGIVAGVCGHGPENQWRGVLQGANIWFVDQAFPDATSVWEGLKDILAPIATKKYERDRIIVVKGGGQISVKSAVKPNSLVGDWKGIDGLIANEAAKWNPAVWQKLRPALSDRHAWTIWPSTPEGFNYFYTLFENAKNGLDGWAAWQEASTANPFWDPSEIEKSRREGMTEQMIQQEYYAQFMLHGAARTFFEFQREVHHRPHEYDPTLPLDLCISFDVAPPAWLVCQGRKDNGPERVLGEIIAPNQSPAIRDFVTEFRRLYPRHRNGENMYIHGEALGKSSGRSDFEQLRQHFPRAAHWPRVGNPHEAKDRINAVNAILRDRHGYVTGFIDPSCERLTRDLEFTRNSGPTFAIGQEPGLGFYARAWASKLLFHYPSIQDTAAATTDDRRWPELTPEARWAARQVEKAKRNGTLVVPKECTRCNAKGPVEFAHSDYCPPGLNGTFLCKRCHTIEDLTNPKGGTVGSDERH